MTGLFQFVYELHFLLANSSFLLFEKSSDLSLRRACFGSLMALQFYWFHCFMAQHGLANDTHLLWKEVITGNEIKFNKRWVVIASKWAVFFSSGSSV